MIRTPEVRGRESLVDPLAGTLASVPLVVNAIGVLEAVAAVVALGVPAAVVFDVVVVVGSADDANDGVLTPGAPGR